MKGAATVAPDPRYVVDVEDLDGNQKTTTSPRGLDYARWLGLRAATKDPSSAVVIREHLRARTREIMARVDRNMTEREAEFATLELDGEAS